MVVVGGVDLLVVGGLLVLVVVECGVDEYEIEFGDDDLVL